MVRRANMPRIVAATGSRPLRGAPCTCSPGSVEERPELTPGAYAELAVRVAEMHLDRLHRHEQRLGDLGVAGAVGREPRDPRLARRECVDPGRVPSRHARARQLELLAS